MILVCRELKTSIDQTFDLLLDRRYQIQEVSVNILMYDAPVGDFTFEILKSGSPVYSYEFDCDDIKAALNTADNYAHLYFPMPANLMLSRGQYVARLSAANYTYSSSSFIGWINDWEGFKFEEITEQALERPNAFRMITYDDPNS